MAVIDELITTLGIDLMPAVQARLETFKRGLEEVKPALSAISTIATDAAVSVSQMVKESAALSTLSDMYTTAADAATSLGQEVKEAADLSAFTLSAAVADAAANVAQMVKETATLSTLSDVFTKAAGAVATLGQEVRKAANLSALSAISTKAAGAATSLGQMVKGVAEQATDLQSTADKTGVSTTGLQEWGYAVEQRGGSSSSLHSDLAKLHEKFGATGIGAEERLLSLADTMQGMNDQQADKLGKNWNLSDDTIQLLKEGREGIEALRKEAHQLGGIIPKDDIERAAEFKLQLDKLNFVFRGIGSQLLTGLMPALSCVGEQFIRWIGTNREWMSLGLSAILSGVVEGFTNFWDILRGIGNVLTDFFTPLSDSLTPLLDGMEATELLAHLVTGALSGLLAVFAPLIIKLALIGGALVLAALFFRDLFSSIFTGEGKIADFFRAFAERWPALFRAIQTAGAFLKTLFFGVIETGWNLIKGIGGGVIQLLGQYLGCWLDIMDTLIGDVGGAVWAALGKAMEVLAAFGDWFIAFFTGNFAEAGQAALRMGASFVEYAQAAFAAFGIAVVEYARAAFAAFEAAVSSIFSMLWAKVEEQFPDFAAWAKEAKDAIITFFGEAFEWVTNALADLLPDWLKSKLGITVEADASSEGGTKTSSAGGAGESLVPEEPGILESIKESGSGFFDFLKGFAASIGFGSGAVQPATATPETIPLAASHRQQNNHFTDNRNVTFHVQATDPLQTAEMVQQRLGPPVGTRAQGTPAF